MKKLILGVSCLIGLLAVGGLDLTKLVDRKFAEEYAISEDRAKLIATLRPGSIEWYVYSILNEQTEGRLDAARKLIHKWSISSKNQTNDDKAYRELMEERQAFLCWKPDDDRMPSGLARALNHVGIHGGIHREHNARRISPKPNMYPSKLAADELKFEELFKKSEGYFTADFRFLQFYDKSCKRPFWDFNTDYNGLPDEPGYYEAVLEYLSDNNPKHYFSRKSAFKILMPEQLMRLAKALEGTRNDLRASEDFARLMLEKMTFSADDDVEGNDALELDLLKRRFAFTETLLPSLKHYKFEAVRSLLNFCRTRGDYSMQREFEVYLDLQVQSVKSAYNSKSAKTTCDDLMREYLLAWCMAGKNITDFADKIESNELRRIKMEAAILKGEANADVSVFTADEFNELRKRVELNWAKSNSRVFNADDDVSLSIEVKNVKKMRLAIFELDAFEATRAQGRIPSADIDLDAAVASAERFFDYSNFSAAVRHTEKIDLPELKKPGLYVVECSGGGICSRVMVRKGRLRAVERRFAGGYLFAALNENGEVVKNARLWVDNTAFTADKDGMIAVPFAADAKSCGKKTAIIGDGKLATTIFFNHVQEEYALSIDGYLPAESIVAGKRAKVLLRSKLLTSGHTTSLKILENPELSISLTDINGRRQTKTLRDFKLADDEETEVPFIVPENLVKVELELKGALKKMSDRSKVAMSAKYEFNVNGIMNTEHIEQYFLRHAKEGYYLEVRGRNGEPVPHRIVELEFVTRMFGDTGKPKLTLQTDSEGRIALGELPEVEKLKLRVSTRGLSTIGTGSRVVALWKLIDKPTIEPIMVAAEGEIFEIPFRNLFQGEWPGAKRMESRVSLLADAGGNNFIDDFVRHCVYSNGVVRIAGLPAGDYRLTFRDRGISTRLCVVKTQGAIGAGGVVAGRHRALTNTGVPSQLRIENAEIDADGKLRLKLEGNNTKTRVHILASRTQAREGKQESLFKFFLRTSMMPNVTEFYWGGRTSDYISGRDLGMKLKYVLDRRDHPSRIGIMLPKPSMILNPWTSADTSNANVQLRGGEEWRTTAAPEAGGSQDGNTLMSPLRANRGVQIVNDGYDYSFLTAGAELRANVRTQEDGTLIYDLAKEFGAELDAQMVTIVAFDGRRVDKVELLGADRPLRCRDTRHHKVKDIAAAQRSKSYSTVEEVMDLYTALGSDVKAQGFGALARWHKMGEEEKRNFYGDHASHELDFFLYKKDRAFFDSTVKPHLANKRSKDFVDKWLLDEDLSDYAVMSRLDELNAFEQCLLAERVKGLAPVVRRKFADWCETHPIAVDGALDTALGIAEDSDFLNKLSHEIDKIYSSNDEEMQFDTAPMMSTRFSPRIFYSRKMANDDDDVVFDQQTPGPKVLGNTKSVATRVNQDEALYTTRREIRQFYKPLESTREWVESYYWRKKATDLALTILPVNTFWLDYAKALESSAKDPFCSTNILHMTENVHSALIALALTDLPFETGDSKDCKLTFVAPNTSEDAKKCTITCHYFAHQGGRPVSELKEHDASKPFYKGSLYDKRLVFSNPTCEKLKFHYLMEVPDGSIPLCGGSRQENLMIVVEPYSIVTKGVSFYFPQAESSELKVFAENTSVDPESWSEVSQNGSQQDVLKFLCEKNLEKIDLADIYWRMNDSKFAEQVYEILTKRGVYSAKLWIGDAQYHGELGWRWLREALARRENQRKLASRIGPMFGSKLVELEPESAGVFMHKEYWPIVNTRAHAPDGAGMIANRELAGQYRRFLDVLAVKKTLSDEDRLLMTVYLLAQDRVEEAREQWRKVDGKRVIERMQYDYLAAYFAFCDGDIKRGGSIASKYADYPMMFWRNRFREMLSQISEIEKRKIGEMADQAASLAPTLAVDTMKKGGVVDSIVIKSRNVDECEVRIYPNDAEVMFSKRPFGSDNAGGDIARYMKPAWSRKVALKDVNEAQLALPAELKSQNLTVIASGADGRAEARMEVTPRLLDVQVSREYRQLRVRDVNGKVLAGAYVKVYSRSSPTGEVLFHKDGYTDLRGAFDYESVSGELKDVPAEFAILVIHDKEGSKTLTVNCK